MASSRSSRSGGKWYYLGRPLCLYHEEFASYPRDRSNEDGLRDRLTTLVAAAGDEHPMITFGRILIETARLDNQWRAFRAFAGKSLANFSKQP
jgi:hypothetical protein